MECHKCCKAFYATGWQTGKSHRIWVQINQSDGAVNAGNPVKLRIPQYLGYALKI